MYTIININTNKQIILPSGCRLDVVIMVIPFSIKEDNKFFKIIASAISVTLKKIVL